MIKATELTDYIDPQGVKYSFNVPATIGRWVFSEAGYGTPPIDYVTQRGAQQHGDTVVGTWLRPRVVQLLIRANWCSRDAYWAGRAGLLNAIRFNRQTVPGGTQPGVLRKTLGDGTQRALDVFITEGPRFEPDQIGRWDQWSYQEVLRFTAYNPVWYDPTVQEELFTQYGVDLAFPITFPITFASFAPLAPTWLGHIIAYSGTWIEYPTIVITGPFQAPSILNTTTGELLQLEYNLAPAETVTIDLSYGAKTVVSSVNGNVIGTLSTDSDLATWHLAPEPEAPGGLNAVKVNGYGTNADSQVVISYRSRYFGI